MIIKATRLQAWALAGGARVGRRPPLENKKKLYWGSFLLPFLHMGAFLLRFSHFWRPFCYFLLHGGCSITGDSLWVLRYNRIQTQTHWVDILIIYYIQNIK